MIDSFANEIGIPSVEIVQPTRVATMGVGKSQLTS